MDNDDRDDMTEMRGYMTPEPNKIYLGDNVKTMQSWPDSFVQTCVTSPPYWGLRDYGTAEWDGGDDNCDHLQTNDQLDPRVTKQTQNAGTSKIRYKNKCGKCGAICVDSQLGLEDTPEKFVAGMVAVFREVKRVMRDDGTLWLNLGDSYASATKGSGGPSAKQDTNAGSRYGDRHFDLDAIGLWKEKSKPKPKEHKPWGHERKDLQD